MEITLEQVKEFFEQNKENEEVKAYLQGFKHMSVEEMQQLFSENQDYKKWLDSEKDKHFSKGLETWKKNNLQKLIDDEIKKRFPEADPKDVKLKELEAKIQQMEQEKLRESLKNKALTLATEKKLPIHQLIDFLIGQDEESTIQNLAKFEEVWTQNLQILVDEKLKTSGVTPKDGDKPKTFSKEQLSNMTPDEINKHWDIIKDSAL